MKLPHRRQFLHLAAGAAALPVLACIARAQTYPVRPVRVDLLHVPYRGSGPMLADLSAARFRWHSTTYRRPSSTSERVSYVRLQ